MPKGERHGQVRLLSIWVYEDEYNRLIKLLRPRESMAKLMKRYMQSHRNMVKKLKDSKKKNRKMKK